jgi:hypothetical protein
MNLSNKNTDIFTYHKNIDIFLSLNNSHNDLIHYKNITIFLKNNYEFPKLTYYINNNNFEIIDNKINIYNQWIFSIVILVMMILLVI